MKPLEWIDSQITQGLNVSQIYELFREFQTKTGSPAQAESFRRIVRRRFSKRPKISGNEVHVTEETEGPNRRIVTTSSQIRTVEQLIKYTYVDLSVWQVVRHVVNSWGSAENENFQVKAWLSRREGIDPRVAVRDLIRDAKNYAPRYPKIRRRDRISSGYMFEISLFDHHFGQLSWGPETGGGDYDVKIARNLALDAVDYLLTQAQSVTPEKICFTLGNDFFNVNNKELTTSRGGVLQAEDGRWRKTFLAARRLWVEIVERCLQVAPVDLYVIPGNHDEERVFCLGDSLESWFAAADDVMVDNSPNPRKYLRWGQCLIGLTHGDRERRGRGVLVNLMATERPHDWAESRYREWHKGHWHAASATAFQVLDEELGVRERVLPSLVDLDDYHAGKGYSHLRESTGMAWHRNQGLTDIYMYHPREAA